MTTDIFGHYCMSHNVSLTKAILLTTEIIICGLLFAEISIQEYKGVKDKFSKLPYEIAIFDSLKTVEHEQVHMVQPHRSLNGKEIKKKNTPLVLFVSLHNFFKWLNNVQNK